MTPPRFPLGPSEAHAVAYAVTLLRALADARDEDGSPTPGNRERAAAALGMSVRTLSDHITRLGLDELCRSGGEGALWPRAVRQPWRKRRAAATP